MRAFGIAVGRLAGRALYSSIECSPDCDSVDLNEWNDKLHEHFLRLSRSRSIQSSDESVFALEHGLTAEQIEDLRSAIRTHVARLQPSNQHRLAWVVYATESGYSYSGDEYWQTFADETPGWAARGNRYWLRSCFQYFAETFGGATPTGPWARQFSIIAWPITHAILPKDLQRHLARTLYDIRYLVRQEELDDPRSLGHLIRGRSRSTSSRFNQLTQEAVLIGQISAALLLRGQQGERTRILPTTLDRIATDLEEQRRAREWLGQAQAETTTRLRQRRLTPNRGTRGQLMPATSAEVRSEIASLALEPQMLLLADDPDWRVYVEIPDLSPLISRFPQLEEALRNSRCKVSGAVQDRWMARGRVLSGSRRVEIESWPRRNEALIQFEQSKPELERLFSADCLVRPGPVWLFEHQTDGFSREVKSKKVKPGRNYIVVRSDHLHTDSDWLVPIRLKAGDVHAVLLTVPSPIDSDFIPVAEALGLAVSAEIEVWPAGLAPASWDGTGRAVWRTTDTPRIGLRANLEIECLAIAIGAADAVSYDLPALVGGESCFVELPSMEVGTYKLSVVAGRGGSSASEIGSLEIVIREPYPWAPATDESSPLLVIPDPRAPTLEEFWEGNATFHVYGPSSCSVECHLSLYESRADAPFSETVLPAFTPPLEPRQWRKSISAHLDEMPNSHSAFDRTSRCQIEFRAHALGMFRLECERDSTPVRWIAKHVSRDGYRLRVVDDRGSDLNLDLKYFSYCAPEDGQHLDVASHVAAAGVSAPGGLYIARWDEEHQAVVVPDQIRSLQDLDVDPEVHLGTRSKRRAMELLRCIQTWQGAGLRGDLTALARRNKVVDTLLSALVDVLGNPGWMEAEKAFERNRDSRATNRLERFVATDSSDNLYGTMRDTCRRLDGNHRELRRVCVHRIATQEFRRHSVRRKLRQAPVQQLPSAHALFWLAQFALRLVSAPQTVQDWAHANFEFGLDHLYRQPKLLGIARFAVLVARRELTPEPLDLDVLYTGWDWE